MKMREVRRIIEQEYGIEGFEVCDSLSGNIYTDDGTMESLGLYPKGMVIVLTPK